MIGTGDDMELDLVLLTGREQRVAEVVAALYVDIGIGLADGQKQPAAEVVGVARAGILFVPRTNWVA